MGKENPLRINRIIVLSFFMHVMLFVAVMDIYFASPIEKGMTPYKMNYTAPAKRVVLIVADGLRAESVYDEKHEDRMPYLKNIKLKRGTWGVSHTRVPTESRPGHVAMMAGIYEDPSAIFKGWKANPVDFDSVLNQSTNAWCWGSPDIMHLFDKPGMEHIHVDAYDSELEDFGETDTYTLDTWVFDKVKKFTLHKTASSKDCGDVCGSKTIFFLHLLGLDTAGHSHKPNSEKHIKNMQIVDAGIQKMEELFTYAFKDNDTAFIFTSDHGMTNWGSHGDGSDHETETVFVGWGAGFKKNSKRIDLNQSDIAPLVSTLLGINIPINSVGMLPLQFLSMPPQGIANALVANANQLVAQYQIKNAKLKKSTIPILYQPFEYDSAFDNLLLSLHSNLNNEQYSQVIDQAHDIMNLAQNGMRYIQRYYRTPLLIIISLGFIFWLIYLAIAITDSLERQENLYRRRVSISSTIKFAVRISLGLIFILVVAFINVQALSNKIYFYALFPITMLYLLTTQLETLVNMLIFISRFGWLSFFKLAALYFLGIELLAISFFQREYLLFIMMSIGLWLYSTQINTWKKIVWFLTMSALGAFSLFPTLTVSFVYKIFIFVVVAWIYLYFYQFRTIQHQYLNLHTVDKINYTIILHLQLVLFVLGACNTLVVATQFEYDEETYYTSHFLSWLILGLSLCTISLSPSNLVLRMGNIFSSLMGIYIMFCNYLEGPFIILLMTVLLQWIYYEYQLNPQRQGSSIIHLDFAHKTKDIIKDNSGDFRKSFFLLAFIIMSFFGTGNIASLSSFNPMWVRCFLTVFSPFTMFALILIKITIPFLLVICSFKAIYVCSEKRITNVFCIVLFYCDVMVLQFMFFIKDEGSWREIGTQLSNFIIVELITVILIIYYFLATWLTTNALYIRLIQITTHFIAKTVNCH